MQLFIVWQGSGLVNLYKLDYLREDASTFTYIWALLHYYWDISI